MDMMQMMAQMIWGWGMAMMLLNFLGGLLVLGLLIVGIVAGVQWLLGRDLRGTRSEDTALEILKQRYARSELTKE